MNEIVLLDLFSGIGGFSLGLKEAGFNITTHYSSEIDKHAKAIYKYQFKDAIHVGSVTDLDGRRITRPNIITFGSPCQDFSVAGRRAGLGGERSSLIGEAIRLITECRPDIFIWENVKGVFSSNDGADFWAVIQAFANIGGYRLEWQLLNTAWVLPQNRERIYLIGHLAESRRGFRRVFPFRDSDKEYDKVQQDETGEGGRSSCLGTRYGQRWTDETYVLIEPTQKHGDDREYSDNTPTIQSRYGTGGDNVPYVISHYGHKDKPPQESEISPTLKANSHGHEPMTITTHQPRCGDPNKGGTGLLESNDFCFTLDTTPHYVNRIRRLTEIECERLQGFPDNWTEYGDYEGVVKKVAKTQRYKCLGNAVTVAIVKEVGLRLKEI